MKKKAGRKEVEEWREREKTPTPRTAAAVRGLHSTPHLSGGGANGEAGRGD